MKQGRRILLLAVAAGLALGAACKKAPAPLATLVEASGVVDRERAGAWGGVEAGATFAIGDAVRTGATSGARVAFAGGRVLRMGERAQVRFTTEAPRPDGPTLTFEVGEARLEGEGPVYVSTARGVARLEPGTQLRVRGDVERTHFEVLVGSAALEGGVSWKAGEGLVIAVGGATMERDQIEIGRAQVEPLADAPVRSDPEPPDPEPAAPEGAERRAAEEDRTRGPKPVDRPGPVDLTVPAGESAIIHSPRGPVAVRVLFDGACAQGGTVELVRKGRGAQRVTGATAAVLALPPGVHRYRLLCLGETTPKGGGTLTFRADSGTAPVPRTAPVNSIDADGRKYIVLYQNRLPSITFVWPNAPASAASHTLHVEADGKERTFDAESGRHRLTSGQVPEGAHVWWFSAGALSSPRTTLEVRFDNAAATAQLQSPREGGKVTEAEVEVAGVAMEGSRVTVAGQPLPVDAQGRFRGRAPAPSGDERGIAIRLEHPRSGVHYYVRRVVAVR